METYLVSVSCIWKCVVADVPEEHDQDRTVAIVKFC